MDLFPANQTLSARYVTDVDLLPPCREDPINAALHRPRIIGTSFRRKQILCWCRTNEPANHQEYRQPRKYRNCLDRYPSPARHRHRRSPDNSLIHAPAYSTTLRQRLPRRWMRQPGSDTSGPAKECCSRPEPRVSHRQTRWHPPPGSTRPR